MSGFESTPWMAVKMMETMTGSQSDKQSKSADNSEELVDRFLDAIWMERGLSANTLGAYRADLMTLERRLAERNIPIEKAEKADLLEFIAGRVEGQRRRADHEKRQQRNHDENPGRRISK